MIGFTLAILGRAAEAEAPLTQRAEQFVDALVAGGFSKDHATFDDTLARAMSVEQLGAAWAGLQMRAGKFVKRHDTREETQGAYIIAHVTCEFADAWIDTRVVYNQAGKIAGLHFLPARRPNQQAPPYAKPEMFTEVSVEFGDPDWRLTGTLTLPKEGKSFPAVILVHGSGPNDRDETVGANKPFRDLAWGLASRGIAVLRYDKRTRVHQARLANSIASFTVKEEVIDDAGHALRFLRQRTDIDSRHLFVLGHSLGGQLAPRIVRDHPGVAGIAILAGSTRPLEDMMVQQTEYIAKLDGEVSAAEREQLDQLKAVATRVRELTDKDAGGAAPLLGAAPNYWLDLRAYDAPKTAAQFTLPILILQGERDYQVTLTDFFNWKTALADQTNAQFKTYPALNHLFIAGTGKSGPGEYQVPGFVSEEVVQDLAEWVKRW